MATISVAEPTSTTQEHIQMIVYITSVLSIVGSLFIITSHHRKRYEKRDFTSKMVYVMSCIDLCDASFKLFGTMGYTRMWLCNIQGFVMNSAGISGVTWLACMAFTWYRWIVCRDDETKLHSWFRWFCVVSFLPSGAESLYLAFDGKYGHADFYCWIGDEYGDLRVYLFFTWVFASAVVIITLAILVAMDISRRQHSQHNREAVSSSKLICSKLTAYVAIYVVVWGPCIANRCSVVLLHDHYWIYLSVVVQFATGKSIYELLVIHIVCNNSQGFLNAFVYGSVIQAVRRAIFGSIPRDIASNTGSFNTIPNVVHEDEAPGVTVSIFATTFNMGECPVPADLAQWIPYGHDIYVIGVQECLHLGDLRAMMKAYLERGMRTPFAEYTREIGSTNTMLGYHGYIAITIYVAEYDIASGHFYMPMPSKSEVNCGKTLSFRTANKGAVGFAFRYMDTSIAVVSCHLSSDHKGKTNVERRNDDAALIVQSLHLSGDTMGISFPLLHHHTIFMGDMNYRLSRFNATPETIVDLVHRALAHKKWPHLSTPHVELSPASIPLHIVSSAQRGQRRFKQRTHGAWTPLLDHDELHASMENGVVFAGFEEAAINFPPTFRRLRHTSLLKSTNAASVFSLQVANGGGQRVPSYTDRILYASLADVESNLKCSEYMCHESIDTSDHKPVSAVFRITTKTTRCPTVLMEDDSSRVWMGDAKMTDVHGVRECIISLSELQWKTSVKRRSSATSKKVNKDNDDGMNQDDIKLFTLFPLPLEDIFAEQRKLHQLVESWGLTNTSNDQDNSKHVSYKGVAWSIGREHGVVHRCFAQAKRHLHMAVDLRDSTKSLGQCTLSLDDAFMNLNNPVPFEALLTAAGRHSGHLHGRVLFRIV
ncbi:unnamed protein product [Aphanomyces euteiches]